MNDLGALVRGDLESHTGMKKKYLGSLQPWFVVQET